MSDFQFSDPAHAVSRLTFLVMRETNSTPWYEVSEHDSIVDADARVAVLNAKQAEENAQWDAVSARYAARGQQRSPASQRMADNATSGRYAVFIRETLPLRPAHFIEPRTPATSA